MKYFTFFLHNQSQIIEAVKTWLCLGNNCFIMLLRNIDFNKGSPGHRMKMKHSTPLICQLWLMVVHSKDFDQKSVKTYPRGSSTL